MSPQEQVRLLDELTIVDSFQKKIRTSKNPSLIASGIEIFQINVGKLCNLACKHCHVEAGPKRTEIMTRLTLEKCLELVRIHHFPTIDITGGAPEMNPHFRWFVGELSKTDSHIIIRSNLTILLEEGYTDLISFLADTKVEVVASLPDFNADRTDRQRGHSVFQKSIDALKLLNDAGFGLSDSDLQLNLISNPVGSYLPANEQALEVEFKRKLSEGYGIHFNNLYTITNMPISRYLEYLIKTENYEDYMIELVNAFNPSTLENVMCRNTLSIGWDGTIYDCDFNQMLELSVNHGVPKHINDFDLSKLNKREIVTGNHCYGCTAGSGSSCQGAIA